MKKPILLMVILAALFQASASAQLVTATFSVTNTPATNASFTINGTTFLWTNSPTIATELQITNTPGGNATNMYVAVSGNAIPQLIGLYIQNGTNLVAQGNGFTYSAVQGLTNWVSLVLTTNASSNLTAVATPASNYPSATVATNVYSQFVSDINNFDTNALDQNKPATQQLVGTTNSQSISNKTLVAPQINGGTNVGSTHSNVVALSGTVFSLSGGNWVNPTFTNGSNFGLPFRSPGSGTGSEQFGLGSSATTNDATAVGAGALASGVNSTAIGFGANALTNAAAAVGQGAVAKGPGSVAVGESTDSEGNPSTAIGQLAVATGDSGSALGDNTSAAFLNSTAVGSGATTTKAHQIMLGTASDFVQLPGGVLFVGPETNLNTAGTNILGGVIVLPSGSASSLINGYNSDIPIGNSPVLILSGPTGAFTNAGFVGGANGQILITKYYGSQSCSFISQSGIDGTATNRLNLGTTGTILTLTRVPAVAWWQYNATLNLWDYMGSNN